MYTLGFEPRAFRMRSDVIPLHHVPLSAMETDVTREHLQRQVARSTPPGGRAQCITHGEEDVMPLRPSGFGVRRQTRTSVVCFISFLRAESISIFSLVCLS